MAHGDTSMLAEYLWQLQRKTWEQWIPSTLMSQQPW
jgi:hypothetical protein